MIESGFPIPTRVNYGELPVDATTEDALRELDRRTRDIMNRLGGSRGSTQGRQWQLQRASASSGRARVAGGDADRESKLPGGTLPKHPARLRLPAHLGCRWVPAEVSPRLGPKAVRKTQADSGPGSWRSARDLERGEQAERPIALVVVGVALDLAGLHRQHGRGVAARLHYRVETTNSVVGFEAGDWTRYLTLRGLSALIPLDDWNGAPRAPGSSRRR
jgi:hypothetical protein